MSKSKGVKEQNEAVASRAWELRQQGYSYGSLAKMFAREPANIRRTIIEWGQRNGKDNPNKQDFAN